jgi:hypothetical protein
LVLLMPGSVAAILNHAETLTGWKRRAAMAILGITGFALVGGMVTFFTVWNPPPGSG